MTIAKKQELLKALGIDTTTLTSVVVLKPIENPTFNDVAPSYWAADTIKEVPAFKDTQNSAYQEAMNYCVATGLLNGTDNNTMAPQKALTRAELMTILIRLDKMLK